MKKTLLLILCALAVLLSSCMIPSKMIVGEWTSNQSLLGVEVETTYVFNEDGTGEIKTFGLSQGITYEINGDKLNVSTELLGVKNTEVYEYTFEGDTLTLVGDNATLTLTKAE